MSDIKRFNDLEVNEDLDHERREWAVERIGWVLMLLVVVAAVLGLFGNGLLSKVQAGPADRSYEIQYQRFARYEAPSEVKLTLRKEDSSTKEVRFWISHDYLKDVDVDRVTPEPDGVNAEADGFAYTYKVEALEPPLEVVMRVKPSKFGSLAGRVGLSSRQAESINQFVYP